MAKLVLSLDGQVIKEYDIGKERMTIGRKPYNDIQIDNLAVSGEHAMIMTILNDSFLEDLDSTNGTMVNGNPVNKHFLENDDVVEIGRYKLKYVKEKADAKSQQEFEKTMVLRSSAADTPNVKTATDANNSATKQGGQTNTPATVAQAGMKTDTGIAQTAPGGQSQQSEKKSPVAAVAQVGTKTDTGIAQTAPGGQSQQSEKKSPVAAVAQLGTKTDTGIAQAAPGGQSHEDTTNQPARVGGDLVYAIQILSGPNAGRELPLSKPLTTLGKPGTQVAVIAKRRQGYYITHVEGANSPLVNGKPLSAQAYKLQDHDIIELAGVKMEFFLSS